MSIAIQLLVYFHKYSVGTVTDVRNHFKEMDPKVVQDNLKKLREQGKIKVIGYLPSRLTHKKPYSIYQLATDVNPFGDKKAKLEEEKRPPLITEFSHTPQLRTQKKQLLAELLNRTSGTAADLLAGMIKDYNVIIKGK